MFHVARDVSLYTEAYSGHRQTLLLSLLISLLLLFIIIIIIIIMSFLAFAQAVINAEIFLLGELQLVAKGQEDAFTLHV